tara:strand:+ start:16 stop:252 length:237 start_codon:yes stop_codon:yes gene_type:complete
MIEAYLFTFYVFLISSEREQLDVKAHFSFLTEDSYRQVESLTTETVETGQSERKHTMNTDDDANNNKRKILKEKGILI